MAKIALCGYGTKGEGKGGKAPNGYAYVVNDSVRNGDILQVVATSSRQRKFTTTAKSLHIYGQNTVKGSQAQQKAVENSGEVTRAYGFKELGIKGASPKEPKALSPEMEALGQTKPQSPRAMAMRGGNLAAYMQEHGDVQTTPLAQKSLETFDEYAKKFM